MPSPFDCYMANRGLKTLHIRMREHRLDSTHIALWGLEEGVEMRVCSRELGVVCGEGLHTQHEQLAVVGHTVALVRRGCGYG